MWRNFFPLFRTSIAFWSYWLCFILIAIIKSDIAHTKSKNIIQKLANTKTARMTIWVPNPKTMQADIEKMVSTYMHTAFKIPTTMLFAIEIVFRSLLFFVILIEASVPYGFFFSFSKLFKKLIKDENTQKKMIDEVKKTKREQLTAGL